MSKRILEQSGQGLIETIIAISIVLTAIVGSISLVNFTLRSTETTKNQMVATQLAVEGVEAAVNIRDSNYLAGNSFDNGLTSGSDQTAIASFDKATNIWLMNFPPDDFSDAGTRLFREGGVYSHDSSGNETIFRRLVTLDNSGTGSIAVTSVVQWTERGETKEVQTERTLYDWR